MGVDLEGEQEAESDRRSLSPRTAPRAGRGGLARLVEDLDEPESLTDLERVVGGLLPTQHRRNEPVSKVARKAELGDGEAWPRRTTDKRMWRAAQGSGGRQPPT